MNNKTIGSMRVAHALMALALTLLAAHPAMAQEQLWIQQHRGAHLQALAPDGSGNVFVCGSTPFNLGGPNAGQLDAYLALRDSKGSQTWIRQFGTSQNDYALALACDGAGGVFVAGHTRGSLGGTSSGALDTYLALYDGAGNQIWIRQFSTVGDESPLSLAPDGVGGVFLAGPTNDSLGMPNAGTWDIFVARYDNAGGRTWVRQIGTERGDRATALASDGSGGVYVGGDTLGSLIGPNAGFTDVYLGRYDGAGNNLWHRQFGTIAFDFVWALAPDGSGGVFLGGSTGGRLGGPFVGGGDAYVARYDNAGDRVWIEQFGTIETDSVTALAFDGAGGVFLGGETGGNLGGPFAGGLSDAFLAHRDSTGNQTWLQQLGSSSHDIAWAVASDGATGAYYGGETWGDLGGPGSGGWDSFLARFGDANCYHADCDRSTGIGVLDIFDFLCFQNAFVSADPYACDCDTSTGPGVCDIFDFLCFQNAFVAGCP